MNWSASDIPPLHGKKILVSGANSGLGLSTAKALADRGAQVTITTRSAEKSAAALKATGASAALEMDLANLASVRESAARIDSRFDVVILNAGIMATPFAKTVDGFELQMATNYLGHFAFAGLIKPFIGERLVVLSSLAHRLGSFGSGSTHEIKDAMLGIGSYSPWKAYGRSKLADLVFVNQLERRRLQGKESFISIAVHPGWANTNLMTAGAKLAGDNLREKAMGWVSNTFAQSSDEGALPTLYAATMPDVKGASFIGPKDFGGLRGAPAFTHGNATSYRQQLAANLWQVSEELTRTSWEN